MIAIERRGRLGNQMFQFAFGLSAAGRLGTEFVMAEDELREWFSLSGRSRPAGRVMRAAEFRIRRRVRPFSGVMVSNDAYERPEDVLAGLTDNSTYIGYFQSERFFAEAADTVRSAFQPRPEHQRAFRVAYGPLLESGYICCHVRRGDYLTFRGGVALPASYYRDCLDRIQATAALPVVVVGDDLEWARSELTGTASELRFERNSEAGRSALADARRRGGGEQQLVRVVGGMAGRAVGSNGLRAAVLARDVRGRQSGLRQ